MLILTHNVSFNFKFYQNLKMLEFVSEIKKIIQQNDDKSVFNQRTEKDSEQMYFNVRFFYEILIFLVLFSNWTTTKHDASTFYIFLSF